MRIRGANLSTVYQLAKLTMLHSEESRQIQANLVDILSQRMTPNQIQNVVDRIVIPATPSNPNNHFISIQLAILRKCLGRAEAT